MFRQTGAGKVLEGYDEGGSLMALLYNFDFDDMDAKHALKQAHADFLLYRVIPMVKDNRGQVWLVGSASRIGDIAYNLELSKARNAKVAAFLMSNGIHADQIQVNAIGESNAERLKHALDADADRAVEVNVRPNIAKPRIPPVVVPLRPPVSQHFKLAMVTGLSGSRAIKFAKYLKSPQVGAAIAVDGILFTVWDTDNNVACLYIYVGVGIGAGLTSLPSASVTSHGPWNAFTTEKRMGVWQFGRWARFTTAGALDWSANWITIETPKGIDNVHESIDTGTTFGAGASTTVGDFIRLEPWEKFSGP